MAEGLGPFAWASGRAHLVHAQVVLGGDQHARQAVAGGLRYPQQQPVRRVEGVQVAAVEHYGRYVAGCQLLGSCRALQQRCGGILAPLSHDERGRDSYAASSTSYGIS